MKNLVSPNEKASIQKVLLIKTLLSLGPATEDDINAFLLLNHVTDVRSLLKLTELCIQGWKKNCAKQLDIKLLHMNTQNTYLLEYVP